MKKIEFQDYPSTETPLNAENLNSMQDNIEEAINIVNNKLNGVKGFSDGDLSSIKITSINGYGNVFMFSAMFVCIVQLQGNSVNIIDIYGTHGEMTASFNNNVVTLSNLYSWDHYTFIGSNAISNIERN